jgi:hypothetical protein
MCHNGIACTDREAQVLAAEQKAQGSLAQACETAGGDKTGCTQAAQICIANGDSTNACVTNVASSLATTTTAD